ncbi:hypothetical protein B296_00017327 [Ensete ventricosum]|uniref:Uncharacterized protein n=1 Tax=Ensete ventricosum TaxID=4639 RepID=A0A426ZC25_ENSVE|nr:hypothetical protein B296_00017327 [Ensete ventricosum]
MDKEPCKPTNAHLNAQGGAQRHNTTSHACFSARSVALNASVYPQVSMATKESALATTTGRRKEGVQNALELK